MYVKIKPTSAGFCVRWVGRPHGGDPSTPWLSNCQKIQVVCVFNLKCSVMASFHFFCTILVHVYLHMYKVCVNGNSKSMYIRRPVASVLYMYL